MRFFSLFCSERRMDTAVVPQQMVVPIGSRRFCRQSGFHLRSWAAAGTPIASKCSPAWAIALDWFKLASSIYGIEQPFECHQQKSC
jgi:hypothetical protein